MRRPWLSTVLARLPSLRAGDTLIGIEGRALGSLDDLEQALEGGGRRLLRLHFVRDGPDKLRTVALHRGVSRVSAA